MNLEGQIKELTEKNLNLLKVVSTLEPKADQLHELQQQNTSLLQIIKDLEAKITQKNQEVEHLHTEIHVLTGKT